MQMCCHNYLSLSLSRASVPRKCEDQDVSRPEDRFPKKTPAKESQPNIAAIDHRSARCVPKHTAFGPHSFHGWFSPFVPVF